MANNSLIGALRAEASLESGKFVDGAKKIQLASKQTEAQVKQSFTSMGAASRGFGSALTAGLSIGLFTGLIKKSLDYANAIGDVAKQVGVTTKYLQEFRYAAAQVGVGQADADKGLEQFNLNLSKAASGSETAQKAFAAVGVSLSDIQTKSKPQIFGQIADQMIKQGGAAKNAAAGNRVFGEGFGKLVPLLDQGSGGMNELAAAAHRLGLVLSDTQLQKADETARKLDDVRRVLATQIAGVVTDNANSIVSLAQALGSLTTEIVKFLGSNPQLVIGILGALTGSRVGSVFGPIGAAVGAVAGGVGGAALGGHLAQSFADGNADRKFRRQQFVKAETAYQRALKSPDLGGRVIPGVGTPASSGDAKSIARLKAERDRQAGLLRSAVIASHQTTNAGNTPLPQFLAKTPKTPKTPRAKKDPNAPRDRSDDVEFQFTREQMQAEADILRAKQQLAGSSEERAKLALQLIDLDHEMQSAEIEDRVRRARRDNAEGKITDSALQQVEVQAGILRAKNDEKARIDKQAFTEEQLARQEQAQFDAVEQQHGFALDALRAADQLATTAESHRRIQLQILDAEIEQKRLELEHQKQLAIRNGATQQEIDNIQARINNLPAERAQGASQIIQGTQNPLEAWAASVPKTAAEIIESLQKIEVEGIDGLSSALTDVIRGTRGLKDAFHELAGSILAELIQMTIKMLLFRALSAAFGGGSGFGSFSAGYTMPVGATGSAPIPMPPGFASGGSFTIRGRSGTDKNMLSLNGLPIARVGNMERISVANDDGVGFAAPNVTHQHFDLRGAVMTEDLLRQMDEKAARAADAGARMGVDKMIDINQRSFGKALGQR